MKCASTGRTARWPGQHGLARGIEITNDLDTEPVLPKRHDTRL
jgi:hypothetical protein